MRRRIITRSIPAVSLLSLSLTGCDSAEDPQTAETLEGSWSATVIRGDDYPIAAKQYDNYSEEYTGYGRTVGSLTFYTPTSGYFDRIFTFITALSQTEVEKRRVYTATIERDMRPNYRIRLTRTQNFGGSAILNLNCTVALDVLSCAEEDPDGELESTTWEFTRDGKSTAQEESI